ncbi:hypothetical protein DERP_010691, partial [Dermatophagoides pteronyssinus]
VDYRQQEIRTAVISIVSKHCYTLDPLSFTNIMIQNTTVNNNKRESSQSPSSISSSSSSSPSISPST